LKRLRYIGLFLVFVLLMIFSVSNSHSVYLYFWSSHPLPLLGSAYPDGTPDPPPPEAVAEPRPIPVYLLVFLCAGGGFVFSWFVGAGEGWRSRRKVKVHQKEIRRLNQEISELHTRLAHYEPVSSEINEEPSQAN